MLKGWQDALQCLEGSGVRVTLCVPSRITQHALGCHGSCFKETSLKSLFTAACDVHRAHRGCEVSLSFRFHLLLQRLSIVPARGWHNTMHVFALPWTVMVSSPSILQLYLNNYGPGRAFPIQLDRSDSYIIR